MKLIELIEMLQEELRITPHADVEIRVGDADGYQPIECENNHHTVTIIAE